MLRTVFRQRTIRAAKRTSPVIGACLRHYGCIPFCWCDSECTLGNMSTGVCWVNEIAYAPCRQRSHMRNRISARFGHQCTSLLSIGGGAGGDGDGSVSWWRCWWREVACVVIDFCTKCIMHALKDVRILWVLHERREYGTWKMYAFLGCCMKDVYLILKKQIISSS